MTRGSLPRYFPALAILAIFATTATPFASAQTQAINGSIRGRVTDPAGAAIPGATVVVDNVATNFSREVVSNDEGYFVIPNLPIGTYTVTVKKEGFDTQRRPGVVLDAGTEAVIDTPLKVGAVSTTVEVTGGAPVIEPSRVSTGRTIDLLEVDNLPLTSRNPYNFLLFQPGVSGHPNPELGVPRVVNTNGLDNRVQYQMDGMVDTESDQYGLRLFAISDSYVREVQTVSNSFAPEFGRTAETFTTPSPTPGPTISMARFTSSAGRRIARAPFCWRPTSPTATSTCTISRAMRAGGSRRTSCSCSARMSTCCAARLRR